MSRTRFLSTGAAVAAAFAPAIAGAQSAAGAPILDAPPTRGAVPQALVLSGGGALGAYEAGIIESLVANAGVVDGQPLDPYGLVLGTSIGALNAYFVATAQYGKLRSLWSTISQQNVIRLKPEYSKIRVQSSGVISRALEMFSLIKGLQRDVTGVLDGERLRSWLIAYFDFSRPIVTPMIWAVTNLTQERPEYFFLPPENGSPDAQKLALASLRLALGRNTPVRIATRELLVDQLRASAAVPAAFDPVALPSPEGSDNLYVDGGVTANTPIRAATALALRVDSVLLNPIFEPAKINDAVDVLSGSFDTMQRRLMEDAMRSAYVESFALKALAQLPDQSVANAAQVTGVSVDQLHAIRKALYQTNLYAIRPDRALPVSIFGFQDEKALMETYARGVTDGKAGFKPFTPAL